MADPWHEELPFYVAGTLHPTQRAALEQHLAACPRCRVVAQEWRALADAVRDDALSRVAELPPLSPTARARLHPRLTPVGALATGANLVWAQRAVLARGSALPVVLLLLALGLLAAILAGDAGAGGFPLLLLAPSAAALSAALLYGPEVDPATELVATTPTPAPTLLLARLTWVLLCVATLATVASFLLAGTGRIMGLQLIAAWLGPLLVLAALATLLALLWGPLLGAGVSLGLWAGALALLHTEMSGQPMIAVSLRPLLSPDLVLFGSEIVAAALLWAMAWLALRRLPPRLREV